MVGEPVASFAHAGAALAEVAPSGEPVYAGEWEPLPPLDRILPEHIAYVRSVLGRLAVAANDDRKDLAQEVLFRAHRSRGSRLDVRALLFGITRHVVLSWQARHRAEQAARTRLAGVEPVTAPTAEEDWQARLRGEVVRMALDDLPDSLREVFLPTQIDGIPMPRVARALGIPLNTGYTRLHVARARFRECLERILARRSMKGWELL